MAETAKQVFEFVETGNQPVDYELLAEQRLINLNRKLGALGLQEQKRFLNNDPLAHVFLRLEAGRFDAVDVQIQDEYRTDMTERSEVTTGPEAKTGAEPFSLSFNYVWQGDELVYEPTGKSMNSMLGSGVAVERANRAGDENYQYHLERALVLAGHGPAIADWWRSKPETSAIIASLCPPETEVEPQIAELGNFKTHRNMASVWFLEATETGVTVRVTSQDNLTLEGLQEIYGEMDMDVQVHGTTIEELAEIRQTSIRNNFLAYKRFTGIHDRHLDERFAEPDEKHFQGIKNNGNVKDALSLVEDHKEAESVYKNAIEAVAVSMEQRKIDRSLAQLILELRQPFKGPSKIPEALRISGALTVDQARFFMDYLIRQALPEAIYGDSQTHKDETRAVLETVGDSGTGGVAAAGAYAAENGISRDGYCPTNDTAEAQNATAESAMGVSAKKEFESHFCPNCLPKPVAGKTVRAYRKNGRIGCHDCGFEQDVCTKRVTKQGRQPSAEPDRVVDMFEPVANFFRQARLQQIVNQKADQQAKSELGDNVRYLDLVRYRKQVAEAYDINT